MMPLGAWGATRWCGAGCQVPLPEYQAPACGRRVLRAAPSGRRPRPPGTSRDRPIRGRLRQSRTPLDPLQGLRYSSVAKELNNRGTDKGRDNCKGDLVSVTSQESRRFRPCFQYDVRMSFDTFSPAPSGEDDQREQGH